MQATPAQATPASVAALRPAGRPAPAVSAYQGYQILRRNGAVVSFEPNKIAVALMKAFLAVHGTQGAASASVREKGLFVGLDEKSSIASPDTISGVNVVNKHYL